MRLSLYRRRQRLPKHLLLKMAFDAGYETGAGAAGSGELLAEALALQDAFYDLDAKQRRAIALDELAKSFIGSGRNRGDWPSR